MGHNRSDQVRTAVEISTQMEDGTTAERVLPHGGSVGRYDASGGMMRLICILVSIYNRVWANHCTDAGLAHRSKR